MTLLDELTLEDVNQDSAGVLVDKAKDVVTDEYRYDYWLYALYDYKNTNYEASFECLKDCFSCCVWVRNYKIELIENEPDKFPDWCGGPQVRTLPFVRVLFNMNKEDLNSVVHFLAMLFRFANRDSDENSRYTPRIRTLIIANQHKQTYATLIRADFIRHQRLEYFDMDANNVITMLKVFGISKDEYETGIEKVTVRDNYKPYLRKLRNRETGKLFIVVNYQYESPRDSGLLVVEPFEVSGKNYTELLIRLVYLECIGVEQFSTNDDYDDSDYYFGWADAPRYPMPQVGWDAYDKSYVWSKQKHLDARYASGNYEEYFDAIWKMSRYVNNNPLPDTPILRMVLPNIIGRMAKTCENQDDMYLLADELFEKVNKIDTSAIIEETIQEIRRICKKRIKKIKTALDKIIQDGE